MQAALAGRLKRIGTATIAVSMMAAQGCTSRSEQYIPVADCAPGRLFVRERVQPDPERQQAPSLDFALYYVDRNRRQQVAISASPLGSYRRPTASERLKVYSSPHVGDWQLFVAPSGIGADDYETVANCIGKHADDIRHKVLMSPPVNDRFGRDDRTLPLIATIRYADLRSLQRSYRCGCGAVIDVQEHGLVYLKRDGARFFFGVVFDDARRIALDDLAVGAFTRGCAGQMVDSFSLLRYCKTHDGTSMTRDFAVSILSNAIVWSKVEEARKIAMLSSANRLSVAPSLVGVSADAEPSRPAQ